MFSPPTPEVGQVLDRLTQDISGHLGNNLIGLYLYGSLVGGDFEPARSDVDLLALLHRELDEGEVAELRRMHARLEVDFPAWRDRIEVDYTPLTAMRTFRTQPGQMARISPGEPLHRLEANRHYLLNWSMARGGVTLLGPPAAEAIPEITREEFVEVVRGHAAAWPEWMTEMRRPGEQAYAVLTLCRALYSSLHGEQVSKRRAAREVQPLLPGWEPLIGWAVRWRYEGGTQTADEDHFDEVARFVREVSGRIVGPSHP